MPHESSQKLVDSLRKAPAQIAEPARNAAARRMLAEAPPGAERSETFRNVLEMATTEAEIDAFVRIGAEIDPSLVDAREAPAGASELTVAERQAAEQAQAQTRHQADRAALEAAGYSPVWDADGKRWTPDYSQLSEQGADAFDEAWAAGQGIEAAVDAATAAGS
jgi:hypothetical protein